MEQLLVELNFSETLFEIEFFPKNAKKIPWKLLHQKIVPQIKEFGKRTNPEIPHPVKRDPGQPQFNITHRIEQKHFSLITIPTPVVKFLREVQVPEQLLLRPW